MPLGIDPNYLFLGGSISTSIFAGYTALGVIANRGRVAAAEITSDGQRDAARFVHNQACPSEAKVASGCETLTEYVAEMQAAIEHYKHGHTAELHAAIERLRQLFGEEFATYGRRLSVLEKHVLNGETSVRDTWAGLGEIGRDVAATAAARRTPQRDVPVQRPASEPRIAPAVAAITAASHNAPTAIMPQLGSDGKPAATGGAGLFTVDPGTAARQRVTMLVTAPEMCALAAEIRDSMTADGVPSAELLWDYMHQLLPTENAFLWGYCTNGGVRQGTWYDVLRRTVEEAIGHGLELAPDLRDQFPLYRTTKKWLQYESLLPQSA